MLTKMVIPRGILNIFKHPLAQWLVLLVCSQDQLIDLLEGRKIARRMESCIRPTKKVWSRILRPPRLVKSSSRFQPGKCVRRQSCPSWRPLFIVHMLPPGSVSRPRLKKKLGKNEPKWRALQNLVLRSLLDRGCFPLWDGRMNHQNSIDEEGGRCIQPFFSSVVEVPSIMLQEVTTGQISPSCP